MAIRIFDANTNVAALGAFVGFPLRFTHRPANSGLDSAEVDLVGVLQGVVVEKRGELQELKFYFFNQAYTVAFEENYELRFDGCPKRV